MVPFKEANLVALAFPELVQRIRQSLARALKCHGGTSTESRGRPAVKAESANRAAADYGLEAGTPFASLRAVGGTLPLALGFAVAVALAAAADCRKADPPAARLTPSTSVVRLPYPESVPVTLEWTPLEPLRRAGMHPTVFVHLIDRPNHVLRTFDHELPGPWTVGVTRRVEFDLLQSALGPPLAPGSYTLTAGLYDPALGYRWALETAGPDVTGKREYKVASVRAAPGRSEDSRFRFTGGWSAVEPGTDKQVLQRRWLSGSGSLVIEPSPRARTIRIGMRVPLETGARAGISATCALWGRELTAGARSLDALPVPGQPCEIRLENLQAPPSPQAAPPRWLALESVAWRPRPG